MSIQSLFRLMLACLLGILLNLAASESRAATTCQFDPLDQRIQGWVDAGYYSGASLIVGNSTEIIHARDYGAVTSNTVIFIASAGKWLAAATIASLVDQHKISWHDPVARYLPEFSVPLARVTLCRLLSHTSGFADYQPKGKPRDAYQTLRESVEHILPLPPAYQPGARFQYGGLAMQVAGRMAEVATGKDWETLFQENIAQPLGMTQTRFTPVDQGGGHSPMLGGGARGTAADYAHFLQMILQNGEYKSRHILSRHVLLEMQADQLGAAALNRGEFVENVRGATHHGVYGLGEWRERLAPDGAADLISSPSWAGAYPWIDKRLGLYGVFIAHVNDRKNNPCKFSGFLSSPVLPLFVERAMQPKTEPLPVTHGSVHVNGADLYYELAGSGEEVIILIHAHSVDSRMWDKQFYNLAQRFKVLRYDLRGYGLSSMPHEGVEFLHADDLHALMQALHIKSAHLVGLSLGVPVGIDMLIRHPENVRSASLASGGLFDFIPAPGTPVGEAERTRRMAEIEALRTKGILAFKQQWFQNLMKNTGSRRDEMRSDLWRMIDEWSAWQPLHIEPRLVTGAAAEGLLKASPPTQPIQLLVAEGESKNGNPVADRLQMLLPHSRRVLLKDCGHFSNMEQPEAFNRVIVEFIDGLQASR